MTTRAAPAMVCGFCGREFQEDRAQLTCRACPVGPGCGFIRCPYCGHENPMTPDWLKRLVRWRTAS